MVPSAPAKVASGAKPASAAASSSRNPAAILNGESVSTASGSDPFNYFVQAGAYGTQAEAEQQKAKLAMLSVEARIVEREVNGRNMFRVRIGPFAQREQAEEMRTKLASSNVDAALVRVQK